MAGLSLGGCYALGAGLWMVTAKRGAVVLTVGYRCYALGVGLWMVTAERRGVVFSVGYQSCYALGVGLWM